MNEAETRADYIDPALTAAGWSVVEGSRIRREYPITLGRIEGRDLAPALHLGLAHRRLRVTEQARRCRSRRGGDGDARLVISPRQRIEDVAPRGREVAVAHDIRSHRRADLRGQPVPQLLQVRHVIQIALLLFI